MVDAIPRFTFAANVSGRGFSSTRTPVGTSRIEPRKVRDHERLVDLRDERGKRARELVRMAVRDDDGGDLHAPSISRYTASVRSAAARQRERASALDPRRDEPLALGERASESRRRARSPRRRPQRRRPPPQRRIRDGDHRRAGRHGLEDGETEALVSARLDETRGAAIELGEPLRRRRIPRAGRRAGAAPPRARILGRPDDDER